MKKWICFLVCMLMIVSSGFAVNAEPEDEIVTELEEHDVVMEPERKDDGSICVWINDAEGPSIPGWIVYLLVDGERVEQYSVNGDSAAIIDYDFPEAASKVECESYEGPCGTVYYKRNVVDITELVYGETAPETETTTAPEEVTTTVPSETQPTTESTAPQSSTDMAVTGGYTTAVDNDGRISIGVVIDNGVVNATQLSAEQLAMNSRLWMTVDMYANMRAAAGSSDMLRLELLLDANAGSKSKLIAAKNADERFAHYADSEVNGFAISMVPTYLDEDDVSQVINLDYLPKGGTYEVELPLPESLKNSETIVVAVCSTNGVETFYENVLHGDKIKFGIQEFQTMAVVGFGQKQAGEFNVLILILVLGGLFVLGGAAILVFVVFRHKKEQAQTEETEENEVAHISLMPTSEEELEDENDMIVEDEVAKILMDFDEQTDLTTDEREQYRAKASNDIESFDVIAEKSVSPARQMGNAQWESIRRSSEKIIAERKNDQHVTVDDLLDELNQDLDDLSDE